MNSEIIDYTYFTERVKQKTYIAKCTPYGFSGKV